jgi:hypothetical protein
LATCCLLLPDGLVNQPGALGNALYEVFHFVEGNLGFRGKFPDVGLAFRQLTGVKRILKFDFTKPAEDGTGTPSVLGTDVWFDVVDGFGRSLLQLDVNVTSSSTTSPRAAVLRFLASLLAFLLERSLLASMRSSAWFIPEESPELVRNWAGGVAEACNRGPVHAPSPVEEISNTPLRQRSFDGSLPVGPPVAVMYLVPLRAEQARLTCAASRPYRRLISVAAE